MSSFLTYILFITILIQLSLKINGRHLNLEVNSSCILSDGDGEAGVCKRVDLCASAKEMLLKKEKPNLCSFDKDLPLLPVVCCVPGDDLPYDPSFLSFFKQHNFTKPSILYNFLSSPAQINPPQEKIDTPLSSTLIRESNDKKSVQKCFEYSSSAITTTTTTTTTMRPLNEEDDGISQIFVVGGENSKAKEFPHVALLGYGDPDDTQWLCGGALISENFVLTAAHCLLSREYGPVNIVRLGDLDIKSNEDDASPRQFGIAQTFRHPEYESDKKYHDLALLRLNSSVDFNVYIKPACLHTEKELLNDRFIVAGWGKTSFGGDDASILQKVNLTISDHTSCSKTYTKRVNGLNDGLIEDIQICAEGAAKGGDTCQGDSGAPLQYRDNRLHKIVGITSFGINCGLVPGVYTRVSYYVPWIEGIVWN
ncbi:venom protease-like [Onthophagus taurus]|uniref:venom protease-like n=1 Tax=Onthophagus taurus TaxID=166361 RepID=UPI0039BE403F